MNAKTRHAVPLAGMVLAAVTLAGQPHSAQAQAAGQWSGPLHVYTKICANCHETGVGPKIKGINSDPAHYVTVVRNGRKAMPAFRPTDVDDAMLKRLGEMLSSMPRGAK